MQQVLSRKLIKSPSQRFTIVSSDARESLELMNWAEQIAAKVEQAIGIGLPSGPKDPLDKSSIIRIVIYDYDNADPEDALETLCRLLLNSYVVARGTKAAPWRGKHKACPAERGDKGTEDGKQTTDNGQRTTDSRIPYWLVVGMAQNLYPSQKARNSEVVLRRWQDGQLLPLAQFLRSAGRENLLNSQNQPIPHESSSSGRVSEDKLTMNHEPSTINHSPDKSVCGLLFGWIQSFPNRRECFEKIFERLAAGKDISPEWFAACIPVCDSIADLEEGWDNWILWQKHIVYEPGTITSGPIDALKAELLLYPGNFGIPLTSNLDQWIEFRDLIEQRDASWIPAFSSSKGTSLRLLAAGRGKEFGNVVDSYCRFLDALRKGKSRRKLEKLLSKANVELVELEKKVEARK